MQISIIGDSASSTIGEDTNIYPRILYNRISKERNCQIKNYAVPGMTSSDAKSLYFSEIKNLDNDILIIYLGNNESAYGEHKGHCGHLFWNIRKLFIRKKNYNEFFYLKDKFRFSYEFSDLTIVNSHSDFKKNLEGIIRHAIKKKKFTILINPIANKLFPSGAGIKNFEFFKIINFPDKVSNLLSSCDEWSDLLLQAIKYQENNSYVESIKIYEKISKRKKNVLSLIAKNNIAVIYAEKNPEKSRNILISLLNIFKEYDPIIYYNLYLLLKKQNRLEANEYLNLSYLKDFSLYRIQDKYRNSLRELHDKFYINYLDLKNILNESDFIDYCHPKSEAHKKIADNILNLIYENSKSFKSPTQKFYIDKLVSPDYFNDPKKNFIDYYFIEKNINKNQIKKNLSHLLNQHKFDEFSTNKLIKKYLKDRNKCYMINFIKINIIHPIFTKSLLCKDIYLPLQNEIFSLPENYIYRIMFNYIIYFEKNISEKITLKNKLNLNSEFYKKIILRNTNFSLELPLLSEKNYQEEIEKKIYLYLNHQNKIFENRILNRLKTIVFWYTRESFRYGTLSRSSMLYDRSSIDKLLETLIVLITIEFKNKGKKVELYIQALDLLHSLIDNHETHVTRYLVQKDFDNFKYNQDLNDTKKKIVLLLNKLK